MSILTASNVDVHYVIVTNGDKGCGAAFCQNYTSPQIAVTRQAEQTVAAKLLGVDPSKVSMLDYEDWYLFGSTPAIDSSLISLR